MSQIVVLCEMSIKEYSCLLYMVYIVPIDKSAGACILVAIVY